MNQFCVVGQIAERPSLRTTKEGWKICTLTLQVKRPFANSIGEFESDLLSVEVWRGAAEALASCSRLNSWVSVRGRIEADLQEINGEISRVYQLVAERVEYID